MTDLILYDVDRMVRNWEPPSRPLCSNCSNCRVYGNPDHPLVYCAAGYGDDQRGVELGRVIRQKRPLGFARAETCPAFESMG